MRCCLCAFSLYRVGVDPGGPAREHIHQIPDSARAVSNGGHISQGRGGTKQALNHSMLQQILPRANVSVKARRRPRTHSKQAKAITNARMSAQKLSLVWSLVQGSWQGTIGSQRVLIIIFFSLLFVSFVTCPSTAADGSLAASPELNPELNPKPN